MADAGASATFEMENPLAVSSRDPLSLSAAQANAGLHQGGGDSLHTEIERLEEALAARLEKVERLERMADMDNSGRVEEYERIAAIKQGQVDEIKRSLYIDSKAHPSKKKRAQITKFIAELAKIEGLHESPNRVQTVIDLERLNADNGETEDSPIRYVWAFSFDMPKDPKKAAGEEAEAQEAEDGKEETVEVDVSESAKLRITHEAWMACEQFAASDLCIRHVVSMDGKKFIVAVGASYDILVEEAGEMKILMRMQETKGSLEFHKDLMKYYCTNHGGLDEYRSGPPMVDGPDGERPDPTYPGEPYYQGAHLADRITGNINDHWKEDEDLSEAALEVRENLYPRVFTSAIAQRLVLNRLKRMGGYDPEHMLQLAGKDKTPEMRALRHVSNRSVMAHRDIPASLMHDLLVLFGGYRPASQAVFPTVKGEPVIATIARHIQADDQFILKPTGFESNKTGHGANGLEPLTYDDIINCVTVLNVWKMGKGREETWYGSLSSYFPLHEETELTYLKCEWGSPKLLGRGAIIGYNPEAEPKELEDDERGNPQTEFNTFGASRNSYTEHKFPMSLVYQPIDEIRDYFGDDVGLYFSWLGVYTKALLMLSLLGCIVMVYQPIASAGKCERLNCGVSYNPLTIWYSVYVGIWSTIFIESWHRRENELRFLWGTKQLSQIEQPRPSFVGELHTNPETGRQVLEVASPLVQYAKIGLTTVLSVLFILFTIVSALTAQMVRYVDPCPGETRTVEGTCPDMGMVSMKRFEIASSGLNLIIIGIYGFLFETMGDKFTEWENHRTQSEYDNSKVLKNFLFQFVNNYFVLFYIAYMREVSDPISGKPHPCPGGNCLPELQMQLIIVFSGKTLAKQLSYTLKPFIFKWKKSFFANSATKKLMKAGQAGTAVLPASLRSALDEVSHTAGAATGANDPRNQLKELKKIKNPYEIQDRLMPYEGTFADFNDRVIQFGYLVLFAPAFPLAPFLAFVNNVIEIRTSGFKMCFAFQRPKWRARSGIGSWMAVLNVLGFLAVITNASMITFVGDQDAKNGELCPLACPQAAIAVNRVALSESLQEEGWLGACQLPEGHADCVQTNVVTVTTQGNGTSGNETSEVTSEVTCLVEAESLAANASCPVGSTCTYGCGGFQRRGTQWQLWLQFVITEHVVLLMRIVILSIAPSMPKWISEAEDMLEYRKDNRYRTKETIAAIKRQKEEYRQKMNDNFSVLRDQLRYRTEDQLREMFAEHDLDQSGVLHESNIQAYFSDLNVILTDEDVETVMEDIDIDDADGEGDNQISFEELQAWLTKDREGGAFWDPVIAAAGEPEPTSPKASPRSPGSRPTSPT